MEDQRQLQQRIRQDAEERNNALNDLSTWMDTLKVEKPDPTAQRSTVPSETGGTYEEIRMRGNKLFAQKQYAEALDCYTRCLESNESLKTPVIFSNRAMTLLKLKNFAKAEMDATSALKICPSHSKSLHRRSVARLSLGKIRGALLDAIYQQVEEMALKQADATDDALKNVEVLKSKCEHALAAAVKRAPRRNVKITVV